VLPVHGDELRRRGLMGVQLAPVTEQHVAELKLEKPTGMIIINAMPDTAASEAGLQLNDVIVTIGGKEFASQPEGMALLRNYYAGDTIKLGIIREGNPVEASLTLRERPREAPSDYELIYDCAGTPGSLVRTYVGRPKDSGKYPAILFVQSLRPGPVEFADPRMSKHPYKQLVDQLTGAGLVTMRVERPGNGDSEGDDPRRPKLADDLAAFNAAAAKLAAYDFVDPQRVYVFAQSSGTALAPALAQNAAVRGVITYAGIARPWTVHLPESMTTRWKLNLVEGDELTGNTEKARLFTRLCFTEGKSPQEAFAAHPELREFATDLVRDDEFILGSHYTFIQELAAIDLPAQWKQVNVPVLAIWGSADFAATRACSELIAESVNQEHAGRARFVALEGIDHNFAPMEDAEESFLAGWTGEFNNVIIDTIKQWIAEAGPVTASSSRTAE
jgi:hypothetical protein